MVDTERARQLTEQLLRGIRTHRAEVVVIDLTGAPDADEAVASHLVRTVDASRLMGASVIITGLSLRAGPLDSAGAAARRPAVGAPTP